MSCSLFIAPFNEDALASAYLVAHHPGACCNPLLIMGASGVGKTRILRLIEDESTRHHPHTRVRQVSTEELIYSLADAIKEKRAPELFQEMRDAVDLLTLDHLEVLRDKRATTSRIQEELLEFVQAGMQVVMACTTEAAESTGLVDWVSETEKGRVVEVGSPRRADLVRFVGMEAAALGIQLSERDVKTIATEATSMPEARGRLLAHMCRGESNGTG